MNDEGSRLVFGGVTTLAFLGADRVSGKIPRNAISPAWKLVSLRPGDTFRNVRVSLFLEQLFDGRPGIVDRGHWRRPKMATIFFAPFETFANSKPSLFAT